MRRLILNNIKPIYYIDIDGNLLNKDSGKYLKGHIDKKGYIQVMLGKVTGGIKKYRIHRLMAQAYIDGDIFSKPYLVVNHIDGNKENNNIVNLEVVSDKYNKYHARVNNLIEKGEDSSIFSEKQVITICKLLEKDYSCKDIIKYMNLDRIKSIEVAISRIKRRLTWTHVTHVYAWRYAKFDKIYDYIISNNNYDIEDILYSLGMKINKDNKALTRNIIIDFLNVQRLGKPFIKNK